MRARPSLKRAILYLFLLAIGFRLRKAAPAPENTPKPSVPASVP